MQTCHTWYFVRLSISHYSKCKCTFASFLFHGGWARGYAGCSHCVPALASLALLIAGLFVVSQRPPAVRCSIACISTSPQVLPTGTSAQVNDAMYHVKKDGRNRDPKMYKSVRRVPMGEQSLPHHTIGDLSIERWGKSINSVDSCWNGGYGIYKTP